MNDWEVLHLDGDLHNNELSNLEYIFFTDDDKSYSMDVDSACLETEIQELKEKIKVLNNSVKEYKSKATIAKNREDFANKKLKYIREINKKLNKEIIQKEKEANKYWHLLNDKRM